MKNISRILVFLLFLINLKFSGCTSYKAGVVEYYYNLRSTLEPKTVFEYNLKKYVKIIEEFSQGWKNDIEKRIIVFPEMGLTSRVQTKEVYFPVPEPDFENFNFSDNMVLDTLSRAAKTYNTWVVVNLPEASGDKRYNTNVVFRNNGTIAARYRKYNLFGEKMDKPLTPEAVSFTTDFGVTFGIFTCFDILFARPALDLVKQGIKNFIFPTAWYSELPFLTAIQYQKAWAWSNDALLLASGLSYSKVGSTGSGIYLGKRGALVYHQTLNSNSSKLVMAVLDSDQDTTETPEVMVKDIDKLMSKDLNHSCNKEVIEAASQPEQDATETPEVKVEDIDKCMSEDLNYSCNEEVIETASQPEQDATETQEVKVEDIAKCMSEDLNNLFNEKVIETLSPLEIVLGVTREPSFKLLQESLDAHTTQLIVPEGCKILEKIAPGQIFDCYKDVVESLCDDNLCCEFNVTAVFTVYMCKDEACEDVHNHVPSATSRDDFSQSSHRLLAFNGVRSFYVASAGVQACAVISCSDDKFSSCAGPPQVQKPLCFSVENTYKACILKRYIPRARISGVFENNNTFITPNILLGGSDIDSNQFGKLSNDFNLVQDTDGLTKLEFSSPDEHTPLSTVGIWSRVYGRDGEPLSEADNTLQINLQVARD